VGVLPALTRLDPAIDGHGPMSLTPAQQLLWALSICMFGACLAVLVALRVIFPLPLTIFRTCTRVHPGCPPPPTPNLWWVWVYLLAVVAAVTGFGALHDTGVCFAVPLRAQVIVREKLKFPSGTATAAMIATLHHAPPPVSGRGPLKAHENLWQSPVSLPPPPHTHIQDWGHMRVSWSFLGTLLAFSFSPPPIWTLLCLVNNL
jgi:hypothetical protein